MGTAVSKKKNLRNDAISSVAAKVRAARAFGEYLSHTHPENRNGSDHLLSDTFIGQDTDSPDISRLNNNNSLQPYSQHTLLVKPSQEEVQPGSQSAPLPTSSKRRLSVERSLSSEDQHHQRCAESSLKPARVYTITRERYFFLLHCSLCTHTPTPTACNIVTGPSRAFRGIAERKRRKREQEATALMERNFRKHLRMVGSRRVKVQTFADRKAKSFSRSWSDPTPIKPDSLHDSRDSADLQASSGNLEEEDCDDVDWEEERELERAACEGDDFIPPKIMLISSKVPKAEYVPNIIIRDDPSIIPILYDHEHATFDDILEEIEKKLTAYRKGCKIWNMLIFCQGGPGHLYLLKNKVATFAKVEKEEDMIQFWKRLGRFMSLLNPEPNLIHIMGCYVLGNANGEKLFQNLKRLMKPHVIEFKSPLELSAQGKEMIEMYFDFPLYRLWKSRQHSKLLDYDDLL
uniref:NMDA receptor synaptonuclear signaling and neuronal migration factor b n=1 Tax=Cyprinus carpio TaxID=7962 RepID=A0A8C2IIH0_CYPCA